MPYERVQYVVDRAHCSTVMNLDDTSHYYLSGVRRTSSILIAIIENRPLIHNLL